MKVTIHQPEHLVWLGLLDKIERADIYVALDTVQYRKLCFQNRNRILTTNGPAWLTVPVKKQSHRTLIKDVKISYSQDWTLKYLSKIETSYRKTSFFEQYYPAIKSIILEKEEKMANLNIKLLKLLLGDFEITTKFMLASELGLPAAKDSTEVNLSICRALKADTYLSGPVGKEYLDQERFKAPGINIEFHEFRHPEYKQLFTPFTPYMSSVDLLFNHGPNSREILFSPGKV